MRKCRRLTLIELLVVVTIILILVAILVPVLGGCGGGGRTATISVIDKTTVGGQYLVNTEEYGVMEVRPRYVLQAEVYFALRENHKYEVRMQDKVGWSRPNIIEVLRQLE